MKHPERELWMSYLYEDGLTPAARRDLDAHLASCPACRAQLHAWQQVRSALDTLPDPLPAARPATPRFQVRWLAAAAAFVALGLVAGRVFFPASPDLQQLRAELLPAVRDEVRREFSQTFQASLKDPSSGNLILTRDEAQRWLATYAATQEEQRRDDLRSLYGSIAQVDQQRAKDYAALRQDMETVAVYADAGLRQTRDKLVQLASLSDETSPRP